MEDMIASLCLSNDIIKYKVPFTNLTQYFLVLNEPFLLPQGGKAFKTILKLNGVFLLLFFFKLVHLRTGVS